MHAYTHTSINTHKCDTHLYMYMCMLKVKLRPPHSSREILLWKPQLLNQHDFCPNKISKKKSNKFSVRGKNKYSHGENVAIHSLNMEVCDNITLIHTKPWEVWANKFSFLANYSRLERGLEKTVPIPLLNSFNPSC